MKSSLKAVWKTKITFLLSKTLLFFFKQKYIFFLETYFFKIPKNLIASAIVFFFSLIESLKMIMWLIVRCFSVSDTSGQTSNVIWLSATRVLVFRLEVANKISLFTKPAITWIEIFFQKEISLLQNLAPHPSLDC